MVMLWVFSWNFYGIFPKSRKFFRKIPWMFIKNPITWPYKGKGANEWTEFFYMVQRDPLDASMITVIFYFDNFKWCWIWPLIFWPDRLSSWNVWKSLSLSSQVFGQRLCRWRYIYTGDVTIRSLRQTMHFVLQAVTFIQQHLGDYTGTVKYSKVRYLNLKQ